MLPNMILFDYGHTLLYEPDTDFLRGEYAVFEHVTENPRGITPQEATAFGTELFRQAHLSRKAGWELHEHQLLACKYESLGITLDCSLAEIENILWDATSPGAVMPYAESMLSRLKERGIRSGVISNIGWSGAALRRRINRLLPHNAFEFVLTSSEYGVRKPHPLLFQIALNKAELSPSQVWYCGDSISADVQGAQAAGIFPVLYEDHTVENPWAHQNDGLTVEGEHLHLADWRELIALFDI